MEIYTGNCGSRLRLPVAWPEARMVLLAVWHWVLLYQMEIHIFIMVDGNAGKLEAFTIVATTQTARSLGLSNSVYNQCIKRDVLLWILLYSIKLYCMAEYQLQLDNWYRYTYYPDQVLIPVLHPQCWSTCAGTQCIVMTNADVLDPRSVTVRELIPAIDATPTLSCLAAGNSIDFSGSATIQPISLPIKCHFVAKWISVIPTAVLPILPTGQNVQHTFCWSWQFLYRYTHYQRNMRTGISNDCCNHASKPVINAGVSTVCEDRDIPWSCGCSNGTSPSHIRGEVGSFLFHSCPIQLFWYRSSGMSVLLTIDIVDSLGCTYWYYCRCNNKSKAYHLIPETDVQVCRYDVVAIGAFRLQEHSPCPIPGLHPQDWAMIHSPVHSRQ